ncbi:unnamed protein product [Lampetra planeri]
MVRARFHPAERPWPLCTAGVSTVAVLQVPTSEAADSGAVRRRPTSRRGRAIGSKGHEALASRDEECSSSSSSSSSSETIGAADSRRPRASLLLVTCLPWWAPREAWRELLTCSNGSEGRQEEHVGVEGSRRARRRAAGNVRSVLPAVLTASHGRGGTETEENLALRCLVAALARVSRTMRMARGGRQGESVPATQRLEIKDP